MHEYSVSHAQLHNDAIYFNVVFAGIRKMYVDDKRSVAVFGRPLFHTGVISPLETLGIWPTFNYNKLNVEKTALIMNIDVLIQTLHKQGNCGNIGL